MRDDLGVGVRRLLRAAVPADVRLDDHDVPARDELRRCRRARRSRRASSASGEPLRATARVVRGASAAAASAEKTLEAEAVAAPTDAATAPLMNVAAAARAHVTGFRRGRRAPEGRLPEHAAELRVLGPVVEAGDDHRRVGAAPPVVAEFQVGALVVAEVDLELGVVHDVVLLELHGLGPAPRREDPVAVALDAVAQHVRARAVGLEAQPVVVLGEVAVQDVDGGRREAHPLEVAAEQAVADRRRGVVHLDAREGVLDGAVLEQAVLVRRDHDEGPVLHLRVGRPRREGDDPVLLADGDECAPRR